MAASVWRMNGLWRRMSAVLLLCVLLLSNTVKCQDEPATDPTDPSIVDADNPTDPADPADAADPTDPADPADPPTGAPTADVNNATPPEALDTTAISNVPDASTAGAAGDNWVTGDDPLATAFTLKSIDADSQAGETSGTLGTTVAPLVKVMVTKVPEDKSTFIKIVPNVRCVGKEDIPESNAVSAVVVTDDCEATKRIIQENPASWCRSETCNLDIFQDGNQVKVASKDAGLGSLAAALQSEHLKDKLGVTNTKTPASSGSSVFVGILVSGLLAALGIIVGYIKCQRRPDPKGVRLAEEAYPVDPENQANTLVSVAPLNPPPETQEKPSVNGESPEAAKTQPAPPTNGHSTAKTADTEL